MHTRKLGRSGLDVSCLCLGTMTFGEPDDSSFMHKVGVDAKSSHQILDRALDAGINFIDTANIYGQDGLTERLLGDWVVRGGRRDQVVLATKFGMRTSEGPNGAGASRYTIVKAVEDSLRRLRTDRIDLYQVHIQDLDTPEQELLRALDDLVRAGKILYIGASNYAAYRLVESLMLSRQLGLERFVTLQAQYSLICRDIEREHIPAARRHELGIIPWSPLANGFLAGKYVQGQPPPAGARLAQWSERYTSFDIPRNWAILAAVQAVAQARSVSPATVSLAWLLHQPVVCSVVIGTRSLEQLETNLQAATLELHADELAMLDEASRFEPGYPYRFLRRFQAGW
ncbi:MAG: aldo/keto reductase [Myxococcota bacterium]